MKLSDDDCDFHLELATSGASKADWIIVEVAGSNKTLQKKLAGMFNLSDDERSHTYNGAKARKVRVVGYAFLDLLPSMCGVAEQGMPTRWSRCDDDLGNPPGAGNRLGQIRGQGLSKGDLCDVGTSMGVSSRSRKPPLS